MELVGTGKDWEEAGSNWKRLRGNWERLGGNWEGPEPYRVCPPLNLVLILNLSWCCLSDSPERACRPQLGLPREY